MATASLTRSCLLIYAPRQLPEDSGVGQAIFPGLTDQFLDSVAVKGVMPGSAAPDAQDWVQVWSRRISHVGSLSRRPCGELFASR